MKFYIVYLKTMSIILKYIFMVLINTSIIKIYMIKQNKMKKIMVYFFYFGVMGLLMFQYLNLTQIILSKDIDYNFHINTKIVNSSIGRYEGQSSETETSDISDDTDDTPYVDSSSDSTESSTDISSNSDDNEKPDTINPEIIQKNTNDPFKNPWQQFFDRIFKVFLYFRYKCINIFYYWNQIYSKLNNFDVMSFYKKKEITLDTDTDTDSDIKKEDIKELPVNLDTQTEITEGKKEINLSQEINTCLTNIEKIKIDDLNHVQSDQDDDVFLDFYTYEDFWPTTTNEIVTNNMQNSEDEIFSNNTLNEEVNVAEINNEEVTVAEINNDVVNIVEEEIHLNESENDSDLQSVSTSESELLERITALENLLLRNQSQQINSEAQANQIVQEGEGNDPQQENLPFQRERERGAENQQRRILIIPRPPRNQNVVENLQQPHENIAPVIREEPRPDEGRGRAQPRGRRSHRSRRRRRPTQN